MDLRLARVEGPQGEGARQLADVEADSVVRSSQKHVPWQHGDVSSMLNDKNEIDEK
jgi:hypothetical protein